MENELKGPASSSDLTNEYNALMFMIKQQILSINTAEIVKVDAVNSDDTLDVVPLLTLLTAQNTYNDPAPIYTIPYAKIRGGKSEIDIKPAVGDIGIVVYCQRDISNIITNKRKSNPASNRAYSCSDGIYIASIASLNSNPENYIKMDDNGIVATTTAEFTVNATKFNVNCDMAINGKTTTTDDVVINGKSFEEHEHKAGDLIDSQGGAVTGTTGEPE